MSILTSNVNTLSLNVIYALIQKGVVDFCICPGARNANLISILESKEDLNIYTFYEERVAAFFALGKAKTKKKPVAVITTSGSATAELFPAVMEAYYSGIPLILITADRPSRYRGTGASQSAEQKNLYNIYTPFFLDVEGDDVVDLSNWDESFPAHINVCLEDPVRKTPIFKEKPKILDSLNEFLNEATSLVTVVSTILSEDKEKVVKFLLSLNCPVYLEAVSNLREDKRLAHLAIRNLEQLPKIDSLLRIGGVPTFKFWRELEILQDQVKVCSISHLPFKGLTFGSLFSMNALDSVVIKDKCYFAMNEMQNLLSQDKKYLTKMHQLFREKKSASPSLMYEISKKLPKNAHVYLGNSLPIREWDLYADFEDKNFLVHASRGINGIDGQFSTFLGLSEKTRPNFAILGDLTTLYDMTAPWILPQMIDTEITLFVINNSGGKIFSRMFESEIFQNRHELNFKAMSDMWGLNYRQFREIPENVTFNGNELIEIVVDNQATEHFWKKIK